MFTIFSVPKSFHGHTATIQRNAILSWLKLCPQCEIILFGDDEGVKEIAQEFGLCHEPDIKKNEFGTPLLDSVFNQAQKLARHNLLMYINADIILFQDIIHAVQRIDISPFLVCGRRWDIDITEEIDFNNPVWAEELLARVHKEGKLHGYSGIDYFIFPRGLIELPPFAIGRPGWDNWVIYEMRRKKVVVINATKAITVVHQNHDYTHSKFGQKTRVSGPEFKQNIQLAGGRANLMSLRDADFHLTDAGLCRPYRKDYFYSQLSRLYLWRKLLEVKRFCSDYIQDFLSRS
jgi:hypothetical protein